MRVKLKAFTLLELLVAMAITGIVVSIAGLVFNVMGKQFNSYKETSEDIASAYLLNNLLQSDFFNAATIYRSEDELIAANREYAVKYKFMQSYILRTAGERSDTFFIEAGDIESRFMNDPAEEGLIDELYFESYVHREPEIFHFTKQYSPSELINREEIGN